MFLQSSANFRERFSEVDESIVFVFVAYFAPAIVILILFPSPGIPSGRLDMSLRQGTNPDITPRGRDGEPFNSQQSLLVTNRLSLRIEIFEFLALTPARKAGLIIAHVPQVRVLCCFERISSDLRIPILSGPAAGFFCKCAHVI